MMQKQKYKDGWRISYISEQCDDPIVALINRLAGVDPSQDETAICYDGQFFILHGDHCEALAACADVREALAYFRAHPELWGPTTNVPREAM